MSSKRPEPPSCLRCVDEPLDASLGQHWSCSRCGRHFTEHEDGVLTEKWGGPISIVLYSTIGVADPVTVVDHVISSCPIDDEMLEAIELELEQPSQPVARIHSMLADETSVRAFLSALLERCRRR